MTVVLLALSSLAVAASVSPTRLACAQSLSAASIVDQPCEGGFAGPYPCRDVDLLSFVSKAALGVPTGSLNDVWGWTDPETGREYALVGLSSGTAFVDVTNPVAPSFMGVLPTETNNSLWRDIKVYGDYAVIVAEALDHGIQIFDLTQLRVPADGPRVFAPTSVYNGVGSAHNVFVDEETGYAYSVGSRGGTHSCGSGLHIVDLRTPEQPAFAGCFQHAGTGLQGRAYTHDVQCVVYHGPDQDYTGREICLGSNETAISIVDVTDKSAPSPISVATYPIAQAGATYIHQGWLTEDHRYFLQDDELDEANGFVTPTTTRIWDMTDLDEPALLTTYEGPTTSIDHNLYVSGSWAYMANYRSGLRVVDVTDVGSPREIAFFDTYPADDGTGFSGAWSTYPYFASGSVLISSIGEGLFVVRPPQNKTALYGNAPDPAGATVEIFPNPVRMSAQVTIRLSEPDVISIRVFDMLGRAVLELDPVRLEAGFSQVVPIDASDLPAGRYLVRVSGESTIRALLLTVL